MRIEDLQLSRRSLVAFTLLGLFILFDLALFGWLIFRSLSQREVERVLLDTREQAQSLAEQIAESAMTGDRDLFTAVASEQETLSYIDSILQQREIVQTLEIRDREGLLVYRTLLETTVPSEPGSELPVLLDNEVPSNLETKINTRQEPPVVLSGSPFDIQVPIGELGFVHVGISQGEMQQRIEVLRGDLMRQVGAIGMVTLALLLVAYLAVWLLYRRGRRLEEQAAEAERLAYIGTLASGLAHEIRNPLNSLRLNMQMLEEDLGRGGTIGTDRKILSITQSEISRLERLATDFLTYAKPRALELERVPAVELLHAAADVLSSDIAASSLDVVVDDRSEGGTVDADRSLIKQLLLNLMQNSIAALEGQSDGEIRLVASRRGDSVALEVSDNGPGIPVAEQAKIFDLFYSTRKGGTGLGLAIVRRIAQAHKADLTVSSTVGEGTTIRLALPRGSVAEASAPSAAMVESTASP